MSIPVMKQALATIEKIIDGCNNVQEEKDTHGDAKTLAKLIKKDCFHTLETLRQAIADADKQEAVAWMWKDGTLTSDPDFADGTWTPLFTSPVHASDISEKDVHISDKYRHIATRKTTRDEKIVNPGVYEVPIEKEWIGLDPEMMRNTPIEFNRGALWAERYLKEKNT